MSDEVKFYEAHGFEFEFTPAGSPFKGMLATKFPEIQPYTANINLSSGRSRSMYARQAERICEMNYEELERALNTLCTRRGEEVTAAQEAAQESAGQDDEAEGASDSEIEALLDFPGVLERLTSDAGRFSGVVREVEVLKLLALVACSAQLDPLSNGKPIGANNILTAEAGRGKNYLCDAIARVLPDEFYLSFESSSAKSLYYAAAEDSAIFKHRWLYPNEAEATDHLVEMFRPMLSGGSARHITVNKDESGRNAGQELTIEGPVTLTIPTVRNALDGQLQSRMLAAELEDYEGRVAEHSGAVSKLLSPSYSTTDYTEELKVWRAALRSLAGIRKVIVPVDHEEFRFDSDIVSHGARVWTNILGLMCTNAWLEQGNRKIFELESGAKAIVAAPEDYEVAFEVFNASCKRTMVNISGTHRKILSALHRLETRHAESLPSWERSFSQRAIADEARIAQSTVSEQKTYLVKRLKFVTEPPRGGLALVEGAEPSWWEEGEALAGLPHPDQVRRWWGTNNGDEGDKAADRADRVDGAPSDTRIHREDDDRGPANESDPSPDDSLDERSELYGDRIDWGSDWGPYDRGCPIDEPESEAS